MVVESSSSDASARVADLSAATCSDSERLQLELSTLLSLAPFSVHIADASGIVIRTNDASGENVPRTLRALWERDTPRRLNTNLLVPFVETPAMFALAGRTVREDLLIVRQGEQLPRLMEVSAAPMRDSEGRIVGVVVTERDITDSRRLERALDEEVARSAQLQQRVMAEAERIEQIAEERARVLAARESAMSRDRRLAAVGQLAAGVMHDVNNALNPIMAAAYLLRHHAESPTAVRDYADRIRRAAETGAATASRVGRFIRQEPMHTGADEVLDLSTLVEEVLELTEPMRQPRARDEAKVRVYREYGAAVRTRGLPGEIREALFNLVSNAMDAMPDGGALTLRTVVVGEEARVEVIDDGCGMSDEVRERAFEPFFTTKGAGGTGLGLAEVYGIARRHRGEVAIQSEPKVGTCVTISLPLEHAEPPSPAAETPMPEREPLNILIVEDHDDGREFLKRLLRADGHTVDAVGTYGEGRARLEGENASQYHLVLTDVGLPDGSGWDLVALVREQHPLLRIGVITGWEPMVSSADAMGAEFVLRKPLRAAELLSHIAGRKPRATVE